jgi:tRNA 5-methylaminomethyl-2-thiouridine biosynthesis bifunctional protein
MMRSVAIIGAGLAGAACAHAFALAGFKVTVFERGAAPAASASGVPLAMFAPSVSADDAPHSRLLRRGVHFLIADLQRLTNAGQLSEGDDWALTGVLERCIRVSKNLPTVWLEPQDPLALQSRVLAKSSAEPSLERSGELFHGAAGWVNPSRLIAAWLAHTRITLHTNAMIASLDDSRLLTADAVVVASGYQTPDLVPCLKAGLQPIRGQVEWGQIADQLMVNRMRHPINGMGHWIEGAGRWLTGATFQRDESDLAPQSKDVDLNFEKLALLRPELERAALERLGAQSQSWVGVRTAQKNRAPLVQRIQDAKHPNHSNVWVCTALGSRGVSLAALCAQQLVADYRQFNTCFFE